MVGVKYPDLFIKAGPNALKKIQQQGLQQEHISYILGSAGGPKALALTGLDRFIFGEWLKPGIERHLLGSSIAAWRFICALQDSPDQAFDYLAKTYIETEFRKGVTQDEITQAFRDMLLSLMGDQEQQNKLLHHPDYRLAVVLARSKGWMASDQPLLLGGALLSAFAGNYISGTTIQRFFERVLVHDVRSRPAIGMSPGQQIVYAPLSIQNLEATLMATASIPFVMPSVKAAPHWPSGVYRDGGLVDYNFCSMPVETNGIVLFPHFSRKIAANWFDKSLPSSLVKKRNWYQDDLLLVAPSVSFEQSLLNKKVPNRGDYRRYSNDQRRHYWRNANAASYRLSEQFAQAVRSGDIAQLVQPI